MSVDTVAVTGGNGTIGRTLLAELNDHGYHTVNLNRGRRREDEADGFRRTDLTDAGEVYGSLAACDADAVVHLGMIPTPENTPEHVTYESNAMSTYHVCEAAAGLDIDDVVLASSLCAKGAGFEDRRVPVDYLPIDEAHPLRPSTPYGMGKEALERIADGFARRDGGPANIASLRYPWVLTEADIEETFVGEDRSLAGIEDVRGLQSERNAMFSYCHIDDAMRLTRLAMEADHSGHERFYVSADDTLTSTPTPDVIERCYEETDVVADLSGHDALIDTSKARELLDWTPEHSWRESV
ncbi:NAD-dependent epimerase/dehydratase family protein [Halarchaeum sp. P4]|uniref:NAD-dependent epimerase/dehydratase family protein n=1 Tax=Halarchaeum sp. P4 TaxID=3421639 RepID=UPI003EBB4EE4